MKILQTEIKKVNGLWQVTIHNGNGMKVHIHDCETEEIARQQAEDRIDELKKGGLL